MNESSTIGTHLVVVVIIIIDINLSATGTFESSKHPAGSRGCDEEAQAGRAAADRWRLVAILMSSVEKGFVWSGLQFQIKRKH